MQQFEDEGNDEEVTQALKELSVSISIRDDHVMSRRRHL